MMIARTTPLLVAALACLALPAVAQEPLDPQPPLSDAAPLESRLSPAPFAEEGWSGEWQGHWDGDGTYRGVWTGTYTEPSGVAIEPRAQRAIPASPFPLEQRNAWLAQCRNAFLQAGASPRVAGGPDACETQLLQYEQSYAAPAYAAPYASGQTPYGYGYPYAPVVWVRVPIMRERVVRAPAAPNGE